MRRQVFTLIFSVLFFSNSFAYYQINDPIDLSIDVKTNINAIFPNFTKNSQNSFYILIQPDIYNLGGSFVGEPQKPSSDNKIFNTVFENIKLSYKRYDISLNIYNIATHKITSYLCSNGKHRLVLDAIEAQKANKINIIVSGLKNGALKCECPPDPENFCFFTDKRIK